MLTFPGILALASLAQAPTGPADTLQAPPTATARGGFAIPIGVFRTGVSLGNASRWTGVRLNFRDAGVRQVNGISISLWKARQDANRDATFNALAVGVVGPEAGTLRGINVGGVGILARREMTGINVGGGGPLSEGSLRGINVGGLAIVSMGRTTGLSVAGLGVFARGGIDGISAAPLGVVAGGDVHGLSVGGLGVLGNGALKGINLAGVTVAGRGRIAGVTAAGLAILGQEQILGLNVAGITVARGERIGGLTVAGLVISSRDVVEGIAVAGYRVEADRLVGLSVAPFHRIRAEQRGITIGLFNSAKALHGLQLGLLNHAGNNPAGLRWLPVLNFHP